MSKIPYSYYTFTITFPCSPDNVDTLSQAALDELRKVIEQGVSKEDLEKVKEQQLRKLEVDIKQNNFWMNNLFDAYYNGNNPGLILERKKQIEQLNSKTIQDAARKYINLKSYIRATLKPDKNQENKPKPF
jgi:zinc protease